MANLCVIAIENKRPTPPRAGSRCFEAAMRAHAQR